MTCSDCDHKGSRHCETCPVKIDHPLDVSKLSEEARALFNRTLTANTYGTFDQSGISERWELGKPKPAGLLVDELPSVEMTICGVKMKLKPRELRLHGIN
jgi:hypothetical protein